MQVPKMLKQLPGVLPGQKKMLRKNLPHGLVIAVVGCGYWGSKHVRVLSSMRDVLQVIAVEPDANMRRGINKTFPNVRTASALVDILHEVDGVVVATPPHSHVDVALTALRAGRHVLIEKPIATSLKDATRIMNAGDSSGAIVMAGHTYEFNPVVHDLRRRIDAGEFGEIRYIHSARLNLGLYRTDVNVVWDLAPHDVSIMNFLIGESPSRVRAWGFSCAARGVVDVAHYQLEYSRRGIVGYGFLPTLVSSLLALLVMYLKPPEDFNIQNPLAFNAGAFMSNDNPLWLKSLAGSFDLFSFWIMSLMAFMAAILP